ncbi:20758_t:CDS:2, partial [Racocetra persica]
SYKGDRKEKKANIEKNMGLSHSSTYHSSLMRSVPESGPVIVEPHSEIYPRLPIEDFIGYDNETYSSQFELFVQSYQAMYDRPYTDMRSYYQVAGIHSQPWIPYDGVTGTHEYKNETDWARGRWGGYCHHGDVLFGPWHRPYVLLIESLLINEAKKIALQYPENEREKYVEAANQLRHPYWDWADEKAIKGIPDVFIVAELEINTPEGMKKVKNPLKSYTLPVDLSFPLGKGYNPTDKPNYELPSYNYIPFTPAGYHTVRHPNANYEDQYDLLNQNISFYVPAVFRPGVYQMLQINNYLQFSNHGLRSNGTETPNMFPAHPRPIVIGHAHFASIETTHDIFHFVVGGPGGQFLYPDVAAFDPLFFFHHTAIDRLLALWQAIWVTESVNINGTYTEELNAVVNEHSNLTPFRKSETEFWKPSTVRDAEKLGYTYPELVKFKGQDPRELQAYLLKLYKPDPHYGRRFFVKLIIDAGKLVGPYVIRVFVDLKSASVETPVTSPHFAGLVAMWRRPNPYQINSTTYVMGSVDITAAMKRLGIRTEIYHAAFINDVNEATGLLKSSAIFDVPNEINIVPCYLNGTGISPEEAGVNKVEVYAFQHDKVKPDFLVKDS